MRENIKDLVTICMPAYNHENFIQEAINSVINQSYENIELLIINDGSPDNTDKKIMELYDACKKRFKRFEYIKRENIGLVPTLKELELLAQGEYFSIIYSDDFYDKEKIKKQVEALSNDKSYEMCYGNMIAVDENSNKTNHKYKTKHYKSGYIFDDIIVSNFITTPTVMMKKSILDSVGGFDLKYKIDDLPLWLKISNKHKILYLNEDLVYYRDHANNLTKNSAFMISQTEKIFETWTSEPLYKKCISKHNLYSFVQLVKANEKELSLIYMKRAFKKSFWHIKYIKAVIRYLFK